MSEDCVVMLDELNTLAEWEYKWDMAFHHQKCIVLRNEISYGFHHQISLRCQILLPAERTCSGTTRLYEESGRRHALITHG